MYKEIEKYFQKHAYYNSAVHVLIGIGIGILVNPWTDTHPVRWAVVLIAIGVGGHLYPVLVKK